MKFIFFAEFEGVLVKSNKVSNFVIIFENFSNFIIFFISIVKLFVNKQDFITKMLMQFSMLMRNVFN